MMVVDPDSLKAMVNDSDVGLEARHQEHPQPLARTLLGQNLPHQFQPSSLDHPSGVGVGHQEIREVPGGVASGVVEWQHEEAVRPMSKKMKFNEDPKSAVLKGIREELGSMIGGGTSFEVRVEDIVTNDFDSWDELL
ncbi:hypothetical protein E2542_SST24516 [Spatholobus suberectus]|nr:hypothetical protein E2542_SST24516 [Spatholobus suberectus]